MKKLTIAEKIKRYIAKHPDVDPRLKVYMKTPDGQYVHVVSGEPMPPHTGRRYYLPFDQYRTRQNGLHTCAYMDVDTKLGIYEMSIVNVCTKSFKKCPAPRQPVWVSRRFYEIGQQTPYDENGERNFYYHIFRTDMDNDWSGEQRLGQGVTFLTAFARRVGMANDGVKLTDCLGEVFYDGHWKQYDYNECHEYSWGTSHTYNDWAWFYRFFETKRPTGKKPTPKQYKIPPLTNKLVDTVACQIKEGQLSLPALGSGVFFGKVYDKYNVLYKREECVGYDISRCSMWNPDSTICHVYGDPSYQLLPDAIAKLPKGPQFLDCYGVKNKDNTVDIEYYFKFLNPIYESLVKIYPDKRIWEYSLRNMVGATRIKPKALHQKLGVSKQQLDLWLSTGTNPESVRNNLELIKRVKDQSHQNNISSMSVIKMLDIDISNRYPYRFSLPDIKEFFDIREGTRKQETLIRRIFELENQPGFNSYYSPLRDACRMAVGLRNAQELTGNLNVSFNKMLAMTPKELTQWHDDVAQAHQRMQDRIRAAKDLELRKMCQTIDKTKRKKWEYEEGNYLIRLPNSLDEIREEGAIQSICIGSYTEMHASGRTNLLFVRKKDNPDQPFLAIEVRNNRIQQIHGKHNAWVASVDPNAVPMLYRWIKKNNLQCEDRILLLQATSYGGCGTMMPKPEY